MSIPRVTIGVPVYNAQRFLRRTLDSLVSQTFEDFEVLITDNCSTDSTPVICHEYVARDPRVRYARNSHNLGPAGNYNRCLDLARGELFKWNPGDDVCAPEFLSRCVEALDREPAAVLVYPRTIIIDQDDREIGRYEHELELDHPRAYVRFRRLVCVNHKVHGAHELYGLMRREALVRAGGVSSVVRGDSVLLARLALQGRLHRIEEFLFFNRDHSDRSSRYLARPAVRANSRLANVVGCGPLPSAEWWDSNLKGRIVFPEWRIWREYIRSVDHSGLPFIPRNLCNFSLCIYAFRHWPKLLRDLLIATEQWVRRRTGEYPMTNAQ